MFPTSFFGKDRDHIVAFKMSPKVFDIIFQLSVIFISFCSSHQISQEEAAWSNYNEYSIPGQHRTYEISTAPPIQPQAYPAYNSQSQYYSEEKPKEEYKEPAEEEEKKAETDGGTTEVAAAAEPAPFIWTDIKVPPSFLRIEYMIGYSFMGLMYGLGFLVLFQSLVVPTVKFLTAFVYIFLVYEGLMEPVTLQDALQQLPPT